MDSNQEKNESGILRIILDSSFYFPRFIIFVKDLKDLKDFLIFETSLNVKL